MVLITAESSSVVSPPYTQRSEGVGYGPQAISACQIESGQESPNESVTKIEISVFQSDIGSSTYNQAPYELSMFFLSDFSRRLRARYGIELSVNNTINSISQTTASKGAERMLWLDVIHGTRYSPIWEDIVESIGKSDLAVYISDSSVLELGSDKFSRTVTRCGFATGIPGGVESYLAIVDGRCLKSGTTIAHEVGHLLGGAHEPHILFNGMRHDYHAWRWPKRLNWWEFGAYAWTSRKLNPYPYIGTVLASEVLYRVPEVSNSSIFCEQERLGHPDSANHAKYVQERARDLSLISSRRTGQKIPEGRETSPIPEVERGRVPHDTTGNGGASERPGVNDAGRITEHEGVSVARLGKILPGGAYCEAVEDLASSCIEDATASATLTFGRGVWGISELQAGKIEDYLKTTHPDGQVIVISGHASETGSLAANLVLARNRAWSVGRAINDLARDNGIRPILRVCTHGHDLPKCGIPRDAESNQRVVVRTLGE